MTESPGVPDEPRFDPLDLALDAEQLLDAERKPEVVPLVVVLRHHDERAHSVDINALGHSVADVNRRYPADDRVVRCVFVSSLDHNMAGWRDPYAVARANGEPGEFIDWLDHYQDEWSVPLTTYDYPETRLRTANLDPDAGEVDEALLARIRHHEQHA